MRLARRRARLDDALPKYLQGLEALVTVGLAAGCLLLDALSAWLDSRAPENAAGRGSVWLILSTVLGTFALMFALMGLAYGIKWRRTWLGRISIVLAPAVLVGFVVVLLKFTKH